MDILQENLAVALPLTISEVRHNREAQIGGLTANIYANFERGSPPDDSGRDLLGCEKEFLRAILRDLDRVASAVLLSHDARPFDTMSLCLRQIDREVDRLLSYDLIKCNRTKDLFMALVEEKVETIARNTELRDALEASYERFELQCANRSFYLPISIPPGRTHLSWPAWCRNRTSRPTEQELIKASADGIDLPFRIQIMPRGGCTILEHWRKEVNDVVDSILEANDNDETREQAATVKDTFFALSKNNSNGKLRRLMQPTEGTLLHYRTARPQFRGERLTSVANWLEKLVGMAHRTQGIRNYGILLKTFLDIPGARAAAKKRGLDIRNIARRL